MALHPTDGALPGQGLLGLKCGWCPNPATGQVETAPKVEKVIGGVKTVTKRALIVPACDDHLDILDRQPPPRAKNHRRTKAADVEQLDFGMDVPVVSKRRNAIYKDAA